MHRRSPRSVPRRPCWPDGGRPVSPVNPGLRFLVDARQACRHTGGGGPGFARVPRRAISPSTTSGLGAVGDRPQRQGSRRVAVRFVKKRQDGGPVRRVPQGLHGRVRQGGIGLLERLLEPGGSSRQRSRPTAITAPARRRGSRRRRQVRPACGQLGIARSGSQAMLREDRVARSATARTAWA